MSDEREIGPYYRSALCRMCKDPLGPIELRAGVTICEPCERKSEGLDRQKGLYPKYLVFRNNGLHIQPPVKGCFVLRPEHDRAAYEALWTYAESTDNAELSCDLIDWLNRIAEGNRALPLAENAPPAIEHDHPC